MANSTPEVFATTAADPDVHAPDVHAVVDAGVGAGSVVHVEPSLLGFAPYQYVALAMLILILIAIFGAKVHRTIARGLDGKITAIREQLEEAKQLRAEAEALREEYAAKIANAEKDAAAMLDHAKAEAASIVEKARTDTEAVIARRERMAQDKIAAAERGAVEELRARAGQAASIAAGSLIAAGHDASADRKLVDEAISAI